MKWASWARQVNQAPRKEGRRERERERDLSRLASWASKVNQAPREKGGRGLS